MRYDDRLETIAQIDPALPSGRVAIWHQMLDMLAQEGPALDPTLAERSFTALAHVRPHVPVETRRRSVAAIAHRCTFAPLIAFLANDSAPVALAALDGAKLDEAGWLACLPHLGPVGRGRLRQRGEMSPQLSWALAHYSAADFALEDLRTNVAAVAASNDRTQAGPDASGLDVQVPAALAPDSPKTRTHDIAELVQRIDRYRAQRDHKLDAPYVMRFDADGVLRAVAGLNRAQFVGLALHSPARPNEIGCDAGSARAFAKRAPIRSGRMMLPTASGGMECWLFDADPEFERESGRFSGYSGTMLRPATAGDPEWAVASTEQDAGHADGMRQLVHELRSPLNAISGFSQLIHGQFFGPVSAPYRAVAAGIISDAQQLSAALEDIELAAKLDAGRMEIEGGETNISALLTDMARAHGWPEPERDVAIADHAGFMVALSLNEAQQLVDRVLRCATQMQTSTEVCRQLALRTHVGDGMVELAVTVATAPTAQPGRRSQTDSRENLFDIQFALQLCSRLAELHGGQLRRKPDGLTLALPAAVRDMRTA